jgi:putative ABC transport system substrate-binding protein
MRRWQFIAGLGSAAAWPVVARAQQSVMPVIGCLSQESLATSHERMAAFHRGLAETGYVEGQNVAIVYRSADDRTDLLPDLAADLVSRRVSVIVSASNVATALAAKAATQAIPVVFLTGADPVQIGSLPVSTGPAGTLPVRQRSRESLLENASNCCINWCQRLRGSLT